MKYLFIKVFKWYWLIYLFIIIVKVNVLVDIILYFVCYVYVLVKCFYVIISMVEKNFFNSWILCENCDCWYISVC